MDLGDTQVDRQLALLAEGYGYRCYSDPTNAHSDDRILRERASGLLTGLADHLGRLAMEFARQRIPPSTRAQPFPPQELLAQHRAIGRVKDSASGLAALLRALPFPEGRGGKPAQGFEGLLQFDAKLMAVTEGLEQDGRSACLANWNDARADSLLEALAQLARIVQERQDYLTRPWR